MKKKNQSSFYKTRFKHFTNKKFEKKFAVK